MKCLAVCTNYSRLYIDAAKPIASQDLVRIFYKERDSDGNLLPISFNADGYRLFERLETFYLEYHKVLNEAMEFLEPEIILNIHSFDPDFVSFKSDVVLYSPEKDSEILKSL